LLKQAKNALEILQRFVFFRGSIQIIEFFPKKKAMKRTSAPSRHRKKEPTRNKSKYRKGVRFLGKKSIIFLKNQSSKKISVFQKMCEFFSTEAAERGWLGGRLWSLRNSNPPTTTGEPT